MTPQSEELVSGGGQGGGGSGSLVVSVASGKLQGKLVGNTREFLGIPYGKTTAGASRFAPAAPVASWSGVRAAVDFGPSCPQPAGGFAVTGPQSEDCLSLNVYTPSNTRGRAHPVMVFIHGGAFVAGGSNQYDGQRLSEEGDVVIVTLNYRLGALGLLSLPELDAQRGQTPSGNDAFRDQLLALKWVSTNIAAFGGDPREVTLFGESAGSMSTCLHVVSPLSRSYAKRFIMESATCVGGLPISTKDQANAVGQQLVAAFCGGQSDVVACLRAIPADTLVAWGANQGISGAGWAPVVNASDPFLPKYPRQFIQSGDYNRGSLIVGTNANEWGLFQALGSPTAASIAAFNAIVEAQFGPIASLVETHYAPASDAEANNSLIRLMTDYLFRCPSRTLVRLTSAHGSTARLYQFAYGPAYHAFELPYVFGNPNPNLGAPTLTEPLRHDIQAYWTNFTCGGNPNGSGLLTWPEYKTTTDQNITLTVPTAIDTALAKSDCDFWDSILPPTP